GVSDREREDVLEPPGAEVAQEQQPATESARHTGGEQARARNELVAERAEALDGPGGGRDTLPAQYERLAAFDRVKNGGHLPTGAVQVRLDNLKRETCSDDGIESIPATLEYRHPGRRGEPVRRRHHAERAPQFRPCREHVHPGILGAPRTAPRGLRGPDVLVDVEDVVRVVLRLDPREAFVVP